MVSIWCVCMGLMRVRLCMYSFPIHSCNKLWCAVYFVVFRLTANITVVAGGCCFYFNQISVDLNKSESDRVCMCGWNSSWIQLMTKFNAVNHQNVANEIRREKEKMEHKIHDKGQSNGKTRGANCGKGVNEMQSERERERKISIIECVCFIDTMNFTQPSYHPFLNKRQKESQRELFVECGGRVLW